MFFETTNKHKKGKDKVILRGINGVARKGKILAILGASGKK